MVHSRPERDWKGHAVVGVITIDGFVTGAHREELIDERRSLFFTGTY
jgi:hypothetical protein